MEIKAQLNKPYTDKQRIDFIVEYNHNKSFEIKETETSLEAWGQTSEEEFAFLKESKRQEINTARDNAEQGGFEYLGKVFDSDPVSCQRIALASQTALMCVQSGQEFTVNWTCQDNTTIPLSATDMINVAVALTQWSNSCHMKASELKSKLSNATTEDEIKNINIDF